MELLDCRRLTGPNLLWDRPSVVMDIACEPGEALEIRPRLEAEVLRLHQCLGWGACDFSARARIGGLSLAFDGPIDRLYAGIALAEAAWQRCAGAADSRGSVIDGVIDGAVEEATDRVANHAIDDAIAAIRERAAEEGNPALLALQAAAGEHQAPFLWDDDAVSIGFGASARTWPSRCLPQVDEIDWAAPRRIPIALVTGTNGKTTTARMCAHILRAAGHRAGSCSTEGIWIDDQVLDSGDYAGPGGARAILRHPEASAAVLETARGGLLRRGLAVEEADVALVTNIAADHLGDFGSRSLDELLQIKWVISRAVRRGGTLVLNADDERLVAQARDYAGRIAWFSLDPDRRDIEFRPDDGWLIRERDGRRERLCRIDEIPLALDGAARHNVANALAAAAVCSQLGVGTEAIAAGLTRMRHEDNPGRGNFYTVEGARVIVDFAHNPHAMAAIAELVSALPAERRLLAFAQAGDRTDELLREYARHAWALGPERIIISELAKYARGRAPGEVYGILRDELIRCGCPPDAIIHVDTEPQALDNALAWARPGDLLVMLVLADAAAVRARLAGLEPQGRTSSQPLSGGAP
ncbi:Mur ligase family protein [Wenzhouxiangella sp. XN24]|uniref:Mur ligase family protein n=1 Tax=Wenzhouxiangella sp. XN24 TaxID=2713569 RepID=UPI0013E9D693|nr:Mur ligase family protein [Wenzhouxiangella sp. XN24]NGX17683.1 Mur ligase [Wenzhouxiangella sp. XN24]